LRGGLITNDGDLAHVWALEGAGLVVKSIWDVRDDVDAGRLEWFCLSCAFRHPPFTPFTRTAVWPRQGSSMRQFPGGEDETFAGASVRGETNTLDKENDEAAS